MLPVPSVARRARALLAEHECDTVLFGAAAPLGLLAPSLRRAGAKRIIGLTHGHEAGWAALPGARQLLHKIGEETDVLTYLGEYFRVRLARALSPDAAARMTRLAPGVDTSAFRPGAGGDRVRKEHGIAPDQPVVLCVSRMVPRKGQDTLIKAWPQVLAAYNQPGGQPVLLMVGDGPYREDLDKLVSQAGLTESVRFTGSVPTDDLPACYDAANVFAMPCRTRNAGLDVEGLGIVYLEASATGLPVLAGDSGGAPDAILPGETGYVVPGQSVPAVAGRLTQLLNDPAGAAAMGDKGQSWIDQEWRWDLVMERLQSILAG
jgi:phosphatidylinositol alpha-1,6-mannosyltransferase